MKKKGIWMVLALACTSGYLLRQQLDAGQEAGAIASHAHEQGEVLERDRGQSTLSHGARRPDFSQEDIQGVMRQVKEWDGRVLVLNFWASWCAPCRDEIPLFIAAQRQYEGFGLQFVGIAMQERESVIDFSEAYGINYPLLAGSQATLQLMSRYGNAVGVLPYTVFVDHMGLITHLHPGPLDAGTLHAILQDLLQAAMGGALEAPS